MEALIVHFTFSKMSNIDFIINEVKEAAAFLARRPDSQVAPALVQSLCSKLMNLPGYSPGDAAKFSTCVDTVGLAQSHKDELNTASDNKLLAVAGSPSKSNPSGAPCRDQSIRFLYNYLPQSTWDILDNPKSSSSARDVALANLLTKLGIRRPSEDGCIKWAIVLLLHCEQNATGAAWPSYWSIYNRVTVGVHHGELVCHHVTHHISAT